MADRPGNMPRRTWMVAALSGAAAIALRTPAKAQQKLTKQQAEYQDEPKAGILMCGTCTLFIPPAECKVVEGYVAVTGWCNVFDFAD